MRRFSVLLLLLPVLLAAACGTEGAPDSGAPSGTPTPAAPTVVGIYHATAAGGPMTGTAYDVGTAAGRSSLLDSVRDPLKTEVAQAIAAVDVPDGRRLLGGVVAVDCAAPSGAEVVELPGGGLGFTPQWAVKPPQECFAPVVSIALALVSDGWSAGQ